MYLLHIPKIYFLLLLLLLFYFYLFIIYMRNAYALNLFNFTYNYVFLLLSEHSNLIAINDVYMCLSKYNYLLILLYYN